MNAARIVIFAKAPIPGMAKTRLIPALGEVGAARLAHKFLLATLDEAVAAGVGDPELCVTPPPDDPRWQSFLAKGGTSRTDQGDGDLGERLARAAKRVSLAGENIVLIGTDCPALDRDRLRAAAAALRKFDAIIHPTFDGGYALLGLRSYDPSIFEGIRWSGPVVAADTISRIHALGWTLFVGETLQDIDEPEDLAAMGDMQ